MAEQREKWVGRVSDTQCGRAVNAECNKKCINSGIPPVLVLDGTDEVLPIANSETVKRYAGEHVEITGTLAGNVLNVGAVRIAEGGIAASPAPSTEKYRGNYRISADHVIGIDSFVGDDGKDVLLFSDYKSGLVRQLFRVTDSEYEVGPGFAVRSPVELNVRFVLDSQDRDVSRILIRGEDRSETAAARMSTSEREIRFQSGGTTLAGTLIMPESKGPVPGIILLHGSGPLTRNSFGPYPRFFASLGFAVLVYDKRSTGSSTGEYLKQDEFYPDPFVQDAVAAVHFLQGQERIRRDSVGLWGSSEGGMLTTQAASRTRDVAFIINSSGFMMPLWKEMLYNREAQLRADGFPASEVMEAVDFQKALFRTGRTSAGWNEIKKKQAKIQGRKWFPMFFETETPTLETLRWRWMHVYSFNPLPEVAKVRCPVLGLFGALDTSTPAQVAVANMRRILTEAGNTDFTLQVCPNANHALTQAETGADDETARAKGQAPDLFDTLRSWLSKRVTLQPMPDEKCWARMAESRDCPLRSQVTRDSELTAQESSISDCRDS
jgi:dienelactone hydrolase